MSAEPVRAAVESRVRPLGGSIPPECTAAEALSRMERESAALLPVVDGGNGGFLGVVLRAGLERGCAANGHDPERCTVRSHLSAGLVRVAADDLPARPASPARRVRGRASRLPVIVVDGAGTPVGYIQPETGEGA